jgi:hypothetical protein
MLSLGETFREGIRTMRAEWAEQARMRLRALRRDSGSWGYGKETASAAEPTALAGLALHGTEPKMAAAAAFWLLRQQERCGSVAAMAARPEAAWATAYACLLWAAVDADRARREDAIAWLLSNEGATMPIARDGILGQDSTLVGWPWIDGTASWVEPTALALLALGLGGKLGHPRASAGLALLRDRAIPGGGWNMGNPVVFGTPLRPLPAPTGLALLALARIGVATEPTVGPAVNYLRAILPRTRAPASLGWGLLGLRAWGAVPSEAETWLAESCAMTMRKPLAAVGLALLLLAADDAGTGLFGVTAREWRGSHE